MFDKTTPVLLKTRDSYLDVLKGLAMLAVIWAHYYPAPNQVLSTASVVGSRCPQLFFIVSAFLTWKVMDKHTKGQSYYLFYKKRFLRIAPIYWVALITALILPVISFSQHSFIDCASHFLFFNGFFPQYTNNIMHVEWYITDLALLYLLCPLLKKVAYNLKSSVVTLFVTIAISSLFLIIANRLFFVQICADSSWEMYFHTFFILNQLPVWMLGVVLYYVTNNQQFMNWGGVLFALLITVTITLLFERLNLNKRYLSSSLVAGVDFAWLFFLSSKIKNIFKSKFFNPFIWFGKHSFGIYCFHFVTIRTLGYYGFIDSSNLVCWFVGLIMVIIVSSIIGYATENIWGSIQNKIYS